MINTFKQLVCVRRSGFICQIASDPERVQPTHIPTLSLKISSSRIFSKKKNIIQIERVYPRESRKIINFEMGSYWCLTNFFFHFFQKWNFFHFWIFRPTKWMCMVLVLIFSKFDMYLPYKNRFWGLFSWFCCQGTNSNVWTRSGSKVDFKVVVSKGLMFDPPL